MTRRIALVLLAAAALVACSAPQEVERPTVRGLLRNGQYDEALAEAERLARESPGEPRHLSVLAVAQAAKAAPTGSTAAALQSLQKAGSAGSRGRALDDFASEAAASQAFQHDRFAAAATVALGAVEGWTPEADDTEATRAAGALLVLASNGAENGGAPEYVARLLETAAGLIARATNRFTFPDGDLHSAWVAFRAAGTLAAAANRDRRQELAWAAAELAVQVAESNHDLAIPIMCDLSSPRDVLRDVLRYDRGMLARFEDAISAGAGCTPGTFAP